MSKKTKSEQRTESGGIDIQVDVIRPELPVKLKTQCIPMVGWHDPHGTFKIDGEEWSIAIAGGVQQVWISKKNDREGRYFVVAIGDFLGDLVEVAKKQLAAGKGVKRGKAV